MRSLTLYHSHDCGPWFVSFVIPADAGIQAYVLVWTPAFAGVTAGERQWYLVGRELCLSSGEAVKHPSVYILASKRNGTLYVGVTSDLIKRVWQHKNDLADGFTKRYGVHRLVWYEQCRTMEVAIAREKAVKEWKRAWKIKLIEERNPEWHDLYGDFL